jgi:hypothetical protein
MGLKIKFGKNFLSKVGNIAKSAITPLVPQTQLISGLSNIKIKAGKKTTQPTQVAPQETTPQETTGEKKIFGLNKKVVLIGGGVVGVILVLSLIRKK